MNSILINPSPRVLNCVPLQHKTIHNPSFSSPLICSPNLKRSPISFSHNPQNPIRKCDSFYSTGEPMSNFFTGVKNWMCGGSPEGYLQSGGFGMSLLSVTATARVRISPFVVALAANPTFVSALFAWFLAQSIKLMLNVWVERKWDWRLMCSSGGMPSSHSALCTALTTSVAICHGVSDSLFPVCLGFSSIVMYDAIGVRRHAGMQAEVFAGALLGIAVACLVCNGCSSFVRT